MLHSCDLHIGPAIFRIGSDWADPVQQLQQLYRHYPQHHALADFTIRLEALNVLRRHIRPAIHLAGDITLPDAAPLPLAQGVVAAEMGMNLHMALGWRRHLLLHASSVERDGKALLMTGLSGSGKSTLSALLGERGWRFMGDELALLSLDGEQVIPYPRLISLKNRAIEVMRSALSAPQRMGPVFTDTPKGDIAHMIPQKSAIEAMQQGAKPALLLFPAYGHERAVLEMGRDELFVRLTQASPNYTALGEAGYDALTRFATQIPTRIIHYGSSDEAIEMVESLWQELAG